MGRCTGRYAPLGEIQLVANKHNLGVGVFPDPGRRHPPTNATPRLMAGAGRASAVIPGAVRHFGGMRILEMGGVRAAPDKVDLDLRQQPQEVLRDVGR